MVGQNPVKNFLKGPTSPPNKRKKESPKRLAAGGGSTMAVFAGWAQHTARPASTAAKKVERKKVNKKRTALRVPESSLTPVLSKPADA